MVCLLEAPIAALTEADHVQIFFFSERQIPCGGQKKRSEIKVSYGIPTTVKRLYFHQPHSQFSQDGPGRAFVLGETGWNVATEKEGKFHDLHPNI
jgi:hypothetical protein